VIENSREKEWLNFLEVWNLQGDLGRLRISTAMEKNALIDCICAQTTKVDKNSVGLGMT